MGSENRVQLTISEYPNLENNVLSTGAREYRNLRHRVLISDGDIGEHQLPDLAQTLIADRDRLQSVTIADANRNILASYDAASGDYYVAREQGEQAVQSRDIRPYSIVDRAASLNIMVDKRPAHRSTWRGFFKTPNPWHDSTEE
jgi:hypothetical protein